MADRSDETMASCVDQSVTKINQVEAPTKPNLVSLPEDPSLVLAALACVQCKRIPDPKLYFVCPMNGHHVCGACASNHSIELEGGCCDRTTLMKGPVPFLEALLNSSKFECKFKKEGCGTVTLGSAWEAHVNDCEFNVSYQCKFEGCSIKFASVSEAVTHYLEAHNVIVYKYKKGSPVEIPVPLKAFSSKRAVALIKWEKGYTLLGLDLHAISLCIWIWNMQSLNNDENGTQTRYKIQLTSTTPPRNGFTSSISFTGNCLPYKLTPAQVIEDESYSAILLSNLRRYIQQGGKNILSVKVMLREKGQAQSVDKLNPTN